VISKSKTHFAPMCSMAIGNRVHLQDTDGLSDRHWCPGNGNLNWYALFTALAALPQRPRLILELHDYAEIPTGAAYLTAHNFVQ
jgi:sugar phosphate isomerase/epimerase